MKVDAAAVADTTEDGAHHGQSLRLLVWPMRRVIALMRWMMTAHGRSLRLMLKLMVMVFWPMQRTMALI
jgi:hypothetical protein